MGGELSNDSVELGLNSDQVSVSYVIDEKSIATLSPSIKFKTSYEDDGCSITNSLQVNKKNPQPPEPVTVPTVDPVIKPEIKKTKKNWLQRGWESVKNTVKGVGNWVVDNGETIAIVSTGVVITAGAIIEPTPCGEAAAATYWANAFAH